MNIPIEIVLDDSLNDGMEELVYQEGDFPSSVCQPIQVGDQIKSSQGHIVDVLHVYHRGDDTVVDGKSSYLEVHVGYQV